MVAARIEIEGARLSPKQQPDQRAIKMCLPSCVEGMAQKLAKAQAADVEQPLVIVAGEQARWQLTVAIERERDDRERQQCDRKRTSHRKMELPSTENHTSIAREQSTNRITTTALFI